MFWQACAVSHMIVAKNISLVVRQACAGTGMSSVPLNTAQDVLAGLCWDSLAAIAQDIFPSVHASIAGTDIVSIPQNLDPVVCSDMK